MYDPKAEAKEFVGASREEAVAAAAQYFGTDEGELNLREYEIGEVAGLSGRILVVARSKSAPTPSAHDNDRDRDRDGGGRGDRGRERGDRDRGRDRDRGDRDRGRGRRDRGDRDRGERQERSAELAEAPVMEAEAPQEPSVGTAKGDINEVGDFLVGVVERMDLGPFEIEQSEENDFIIFQLSGEASARLGAGDGRATDALQLLANQAAHRIEEEPKRVIVDADGDSENREAFLTRVASRAAKRALDTGRSVALEAMNSRDRRLVHVALREIDDVATMSTGEGRYRQVIVVPESSPDYPEAQKYSSGQE